MELKCPKCGVKLPEVETLKYRFCPGCGAQIPPKPERLDQTSHTIPPGQPVQRPDHSSGVLEPDKGKKDDSTRKHDDRTVAPMPMSKLKKPELKPPNTPPPAGFYRIQSPKAQNSIRSGKKVPPQRIVQKRAPAKNRRIIIVVLIVLTLTILILGGLFTF